MAKLEPYAGDYYLWEYIPSLPASVIFLLLFLAATLFHCWKAWKARARFCIPFCTGGLFEVIGFGARAACTDNTGELMPYTLQSVFILLGPVLYAASVYIHAEKYSLIRITRVTKTFVTGDIVSFLVQGSGAGLMASSRSMASTAKGVIIAGLLIQIAVFGFFMVTSVVFHKRMRRCPTSFSMSRNDGNGVSWKEHLYPLYAVSLLIMIRSVFRVIEYAMGQKGYLLAHEWPMYVFDAVLMLGVMVIWGRRHPGDIRADGTGAQLLSMNSGQSKP
ncbi:RTA1 like protein-domain-containing protein [Aspergillus desertorum]